MSVNTTMDELRDKLKSSLKEAIDTLTSILDDETWGYGDMKEEWLADMANAQADLRIIRENV